MYHPHAMHSLQPHLVHPPHQHWHHPHSLSIHTNNSTCITVTALVLGTKTTSQTDQGQPRDYRQAHRPSSKNEINLAILQVNIIKSKLEELKLLIHNTHADVITIQETKLSPKANAPKVHNSTTVRSTVRTAHRQVALIRDNITFTTTDIPSTTNTHNTPLQMVMVHINNTKHITISNINIAPQDSTSTHSVSHHWRCERTLYSLALVH